MIRLRQHIPTFVDGRPKEATVDDVPAMLALPWIAGWVDANFDHWCCSRDRLLVAWMKDGRWWVVAYILEGNVPAADLPDCRPFPKL